MLDDASERKRALRALAELIENGRPEADLPARPSSSFENFKEQVYRQALARLEGEPWFRGVCLDTVRSSWDSGASVEEAVDSVEVDTWFWDGQ